MIYHLGTSPEHGTKIELKSYSFFGYSSSEAKAHVWFEIVGLQCGSDISVYIWCQLVIAYCQANFIKWQIVVFNKCICLIDG